MISVELKKFEWEIARFVARRRQEEAEAKGLLDQHGFVGSTKAGLNAPGLHELGAAGEMAFAKSKNRYWGGSVNTFRTDTDVAGMEVRTRSSHRYDLLVRRNDSDDRAYVLVTYEEPEFRVHGWLLGADAKQDRWWDDKGGRPPAYFVPKKELKSF